MKQLTISNPQKLPSLPSTKDFILLAMADTYTLAQQHQLQQLLLLHQQAGFIVSLQRTEPKNYTEYHRKLLERLQAREQAKTG